LEIAISQFALWETKVMKSKSAQLRKKTGHQVAQTVRQANRSSSVAEQDWLKAMAVWLVLEGFCLGLAPARHWIEPGDRWQLWLTISIPAGISGAFLVAFSSQGVTYINAQRTDFSKRVQIVIIQILGGIGLVGILFPLVTLFIEFIVKAALEIGQRPA
jgi:hypothetical protein